VRVERAVFVWVLVATAGTQLCNSLDTNVQGILLVPDDALRHAPAQVLHQKPHTANPGSVKVWKLTPSPRSREGSALTAGLKPLAFDGTTSSFSALSWAVRPLGQDARNQARKAQVSRIPEIKIGVLFGRFPAGMQVLVTWALAVVTSVMSLRGPNMSLDICPLAVSVETAVSDESASMAVGLSGPLG